MLFRSVSVKKVLTGQFSGTYIKDSVGGVSAQIDDSIVSTSTTYSSNKIEQIRQQLLAKIALALGLNGSHTSGLDLQLEYVDSTTIKLKAVSADVDVIFPNLETVTVTTAGITKTVAGSTSTLYYVYLTTAGELDISTDEPSDIYSSIQFYGETNVLVGWLGLSATNTIAGTHNVYSFWNEPQRTFTYSTTSFPSTFSLSGVVIRSGTGGNVTWSGNVVGRTYGYLNGYTMIGDVYTTNTSLGTVSGNSNQYCDTIWNEMGGSSSICYYVTRTQTLSLSNSSIAAGVSTFSTTLSESVTNVWTNGGTTLFSGYTSISGTITLTRPGS